MAKLDVKAIANASALVWGISYIVCALLFLIAPVFAINLFNYFFHGIDLTSIAKTTVSLGRNITGLILTLISAYILGALFAIFYNKFAK